MLPTSSGLHHINCVMPNIKAMSCSSGGIPLALKPSHWFWHTTAQRHKQDVSGEEFSQTLQKETWEACCPKEDFFSYLRRSWQSQRCFSGPQRRTGRASRSGCPRPQPSSFSTCRQSPPWGSHLNRKEWSSFKKESAQKRCLVRKQHIICQRNAHAFQEIS